MDLVNGYKIVGMRRAFSLSGIQAHRRSVQLMRQVSKINPWSRPRGFVFKAKTREDYETWKKNQKNPWLW